MMVDPPLEIPVIAPLPVTNVAFALLLIRWSFGVRLARQELVRRARTSCGMTLFLGSWAHGSLNVASAVADAHSGGWPARLWWLMAMQSAFEAAPPRVALSVITPVVPVSGVSYGIGVCGEHLHTATGWVAAEVAGLVIIVAGIVLLGRGATLTVQSGTDLR